MWKCLSTKMKEAQRGQILNDLLKYLDPSTQKLNPLEMDY